MRFQKSCLLVLTFCLFAFSVLEKEGHAAYIAGADPGTTGAPGETTCSAFHTGSQS